MLQHELPIRRLMCSCLFAMFCIATTVAAADVAQWLDRMSHSHRELAYSGVISYQSRDRMGSYRVIHGVRDGKEFERIVPLDGAAHDLVRLGHPVSCIHAGHQLLRFAEGESGSGLLGQVERYYDLRLGELTRIAGRAAQQVLIQPRDVYRYGYRLALDVDTGLMLGSELIDSRGQSIERFQFVQLDFDDADATASASSQIQPVHSPHGKLVAPHASRQVAARAPWRVEWLPAGFMLAEMENDPDQGQAQSFTDGLSVLSVFLEPSAGPEAPMLMREGATAAFTRTLERNGGYWLVTVVGEMPDRTVKQVATAVRWP